MSVALEMFKVVFVYYGKAVLECNLKMMAAVMCFKYKTYNTSPFTTTGIIDRCMRWSVALQSLYFRHLRTCMGVEQDSVRVHNAIVVFEAITMFVRLY